jgi:Fe-S-cluster-containing dehydrogenase component/CRP-like cAMP-binding protein
VLSGNVRIALTSLSSEVLGRRKGPGGSFFGALSQIVRNHWYPEVRSRQSQSDSTGHRQDGDQTRIFLQDVPGVLDECQTLELRAGEVFGEVAALSRTARTATVFAVGEDTELLEIRWQGLRELMKRDESLQQHIHQLYRQNSLTHHLRETPLLRNVSPENLARIIDATQFETHGTFEWHLPYKSIEKVDVAERINREPIIAKEGHYADGLILIRSGFARLSRQYGHGHRTLRYLGKGDAFGMEELSYALHNKTIVPWQFSLRAVGYVDTLRIPTELIESCVLPTFDQKQLDVMHRSISLYIEQSTREEDLTAVASNDKGLDVAFLEQLGDHRLINGTQAMLINMDRCTRCDDCVRACAMTHDNNPRFVREGYHIGNQMIAGACMHCVDPVCMIGCPTGAISRDSESGNVLINDSTCIGCSTCANSCPYHNIVMVETRSANGRFLVDGQSHQPIQKATKCDLCADQFGGPSCQRACPHDALVRIDLRDTEQLKKWMQR